MAMREKEEERKLEKKQRRWGSQFLVKPKEETGVLTEKTNSEGEPKRRGTEKKRGREKKTGDMPDASPVPK